MLSLTFAKTNARFMDLPQAGILTNTPMSRGSLCKFTPRCKNPGPNMEKRNSHKPEENVGVSPEPNTGSTTLWLQLTALCRPGKVPLSLPACCCKDFSLKPNMLRSSLSSSGWVRWLYSFICIITHEPWLGGCWRSCPEKIGCSSGWSWRAAAAAACEGRGVKSVG